MINFFAKDARRFRVTLSICLILTLLVTTAAIVFSVKYIRSYSDIVRQSFYKADTSQAHIDTINRLADRIEHQSDSVARVEQIVADSKHYEYQDVIINDMRSMADKAGVTITDFNFSGTGTASGASGAAAKKPTTTGGLHSTTIGITVKNPVDYQSFLNFVHYIELNNTKMQISNISLSAIPNSSSPNAVNSDVLQIEVYIR